MKARAGCAAALALALAVAPAAARAAPRAGEGRVLVVRLEGVVSPVSAEAVEAAVDRAEREGYRALVLEVDTPGGLETSMRDMVKRLLASEVPVLAWVTPGGARAASAGVFVVMAADFAAMAPGTNIGAATPVNMGGPMDSTLARKAANDAAAFARTVAAQRGRNAVWAERAVREAVAASDSEAVALRIVDAIAGSLPELLARADGRRWTRGGEVRTIDVGGLPHDRIHPGLRQRLLGVIADPNIAYILLMIGSYGMLFELQNPGAILPGIVGAICLVLAFLALSALPVNYAGLALIVLGIVFLLAEVKVTSHGLLAAGGIASMLLGSLILFHGEGARLSLSVIVGATLATALFFLFVVGAALRSRAGPVVTGARGMIGRRVQALDRLAPAGRVRYGDEVWNAVSSGEAEAGADVEITGVDGLTLRVRPVHREV
jgi:membrane-bound serine protease (ClpP class)